MRATKEIENAGPTPEQLLLILDSQLAAQRSQRGAKSRNRATILVVGVLFIVGAASAALLVLSQLVGDLREKAPSPAPQTVPLDGKF